MAGEAGQHRTFTRVERDRTAAARHASSGGVDREIGANGRRGSPEGSADAGADLDRIGVAPDEVGRPRVK
ncbi:hypothetical protein [Sphingomonas sp.]|uniref:hypothetical protein n=1 Tax=Sphingomonas sp. TaxID=28214 RepID=UPI003B00AF21